MDLTAKLGADPAAAETSILVLQQNTGKTWDRPSPKFPNGNKCEQLGPLPALRSKGCLIYTCPKPWARRAWVVRGGVTIRAALEGINTALSCIMSCQESLQKEQELEMQAFSFKP